VDGGDDVPASSVSFTSTASLWFGVSPAGTSQAWVAHVVAPVPSFVVSTTIEKLPSESGVAAARGG
jgi:hypothetical protein